jgi:hypothetical protein
MLTTKIKFYIISLIPIFLLVFSPDVFPQQHILTNKLERQILKGLDATFNFEFEKSEKIFNKIIEKYPDNPVGYHFKSIPYFWRFLDNKNDSDFVKFIALSDSTIKKTDQLLEADTVDAFTYYIVGSTNSLRAMVFGRMENYLDAILALKQSFTNLNNAIFIDSTMYDAYMGLGLFNFMTAQTPAALRWAMRMTGIEGEKEKGISYLKFAADKGKFSKVDAQYYLSQILSEFYLENEKAEQIIIKLSKKYKNNLLFKYSLASNYLKSPSLDKSELVINEIISANDTSFKQLTRYSKLLMGNIFFYRNDFDSARYFYTNFLENDSENNFRGYAALNLGLCYSFLNDSLNAIKSFEICGEGNSDIDDDRYARIRGEQFLDSPPDSNRLKLVFIKNMIDAGNYEAAQDSLLNFNKSEILNSLLAEINLYLCDVAFWLGDFTRSYSFALSTFANNDAEKWIKPFAYYYGARVSIELGYQSDAASYIEKAREYSDYIYENKLSNMLDALEYHMELAEIAEP